MLTFRRSLGWILVIGSLLFCSVTIYAFYKHPDRLAAFTVMPIWLWGAIGFSISFGAFYFLKARFSLLVSALWIATILIGSDESVALCHLGNERPVEGAPTAVDGKPVIRIITMNCATYAFGNPSEDVAKWRPDIVLLQQIMPHEAAAMAMKLFGTRAHVHTKHTCAIISRWPISGHVRTPLISSQQVTLRLPTGQEIDVVNLHLATAATDLQFWKKSAWQKHHLNRAVRRQEISLALQVLNQTTDSPKLSTFVGGDFNAPATDVIHRPLRANFTDAFKAVGTGWGNTFQRRMPILRIDHLYCSSDFKPVRCRAVTTRHSDHRFVVADFTAEFPFLP